MPVTAELLSRIAEGDERSFAVLYRYLYQELRPIGFRCVEAGIEPAEIMQVTFTKLWLNRDRLIHIDNLKAWVVTIAYREFLMAVRKKINYEERLAKFSGASDLEPLTPFQHVNYQEIKRFTQAIIRELPPQRKTIYKLSREEGLKIDEIANRLSISPNTVKSVLQTVLKLIKEKLIEAGYGPFTLIIFYNFFMADNTNSFLQHLIGI